MNNLVWQSVMWRPGKGRFLIGVKNPPPTRPAAIASQRAPFRAAPVDVVSLGSQNQCPAVA